MFTKIVEMVRRYMRYRRDIAELSAMSDYELKDIGICRSEIEGICWRGKIEK